jgi:hypothetical protein
MSGSRSIQLAPCNPSLKGRACIQSLRITGYGENPLIAFANLQTRKSPWRQWHSINGIPSQGKLGRVNRLVILIFEDKSPFHRIGGWDIDKDDGMAGCRPSITGSQGIEVVFAQTVWRAGTPWGKPSRFT